MCIRQIEVSEGEMDTYKTENAVAELTARIHPTDHNIPDCMCNLVLTERHLFFDEYNKLPKDFICKFQKLKSN